MVSISSSTRLACLLGHPVAHSASPQIHAAGFAAADIDAVYLAFDVPPERLAEAVAGLRAVGMLGANLTVPHKQAVLDHVDATTPEVDAIGAANTLYWDGDALVADNTDAAGLADVFADLEVGEATIVLLFGAGGAGRAAAAALGRVGAAVTVRARRPEQAEEVQALAERLGARPADAGASPHLVVNATPLGLHGEPLPDDLMSLGLGQTALDLIYGAVPTPFLQAAAVGGAQAVDGVGMLVAQAARAFTRWTGTDAPREAMEAAARRALRLPAS